MMNRSGRDYAASPSEFARSNYFYALIGGYSVTDAHFLFERAYYPAYELLSITSGKGWFRHGEKWIVLGAGDCLLHDMRYPHAYKSDPDTPYEMRYLVFDGHLLDKLWLDFFAGPFVVFRPEDTDALTGPMDRIERIVAEEDNADEAELNVSTLIYGLLLRCADQSRKGDGVAGAAKPDTIVGAQKYMNDHYLEPIDIEDVARSVNISYYHFIRQFKRYCGCTPKDYLLLKRIGHAKRLLLLTNHSITEIAGMSGFNNYNSFLYSFHKIERCSPADFRKSWKLY